jgi:probable HAF family extracellular repeat protein
MQSKILISAVALSTLVTGSIAANAEVYNLTELAPLSGGGAAIVTAMNDLGQVVGYTPSNTTAVIWNGGTPTNLGTLGGNGVVDGATAYGINNAGVVVGQSYDTTGAHAVTWTGGVIASLGTPGSSASGINNAGQIAGVANYSDGFHTTIWNGG